MTWVRANRARLVSACLTLCQAWIAAGRPRGGKTIGSYENWAGTIGGILEVAGIEGFLGNLDEMMAASDAEGSAWAAFVSGWWSRYGTSEVRSGDLYEVAVGCEPPLPLGTGNDKSQRTRLGKALGRMRDRVFRVACFDIRLRAAGVTHQAQQWQLMIAGERGERFPGSDLDSGGERCTSEGNVGFERSPSQLIDLEASGERGERGERFSTLAHAHTRAPVKEESEKPSPCSPPSPQPTKSGSCAGERSGERQNPSSPKFPDQKPMPAWLREVME